METLGEKMNILKTVLLSVVLLTFTIATVGCATDGPLSIASLHAPQMSFDSSQLANKALTTGEVAEAQSANESVNQVTENRSATPSSDRQAQASYDQTVHQASYAATTAPLITLGPNDNFQEIVSHASGAVLVDFYADWCGPCRTQGGILHQMESSASQNNASIVKVNIDQHRELANAFNVTSLPTLMLIKNGQVIERQTGLANHKRVAALLAK